MFLRLIEEFLGDEGAGSGLGVNDPGQDSVKGLVTRSV